MRKHYDEYGDSEWACGGDGDCDAVQPEPDCVHGLAHEWTSKGCGGIDSNPGVWSLGGTTISCKARCRLCGAARHEVYYGSQRNPGQCDTVRYEVGSYEPEEDAVRRARSLRRRRERAQTKRARALLRRVPYTAPPSGVRTTQLTDWLRGYSRARSATVYEAAMIVLDPAIVERLDGVDGIRITVRDR